MFWHIKLLYVTDSQQTELILWIDSPFMDPSKSLTHFVAVPCIRLPCHQMPSSALSSENLPLPSRVAGPAESIGGSDDAESKWRGMKRGGRGQAATGAFNGRRRSIAKGRSRSLSH